MFTFLAGIILRNRILFIAMLVIATAFMGYKAGEVKMSYEYPPLLPETDSTLIEFNRYKETFGEDGNIVIVGIVNHDFFDQEPLSDWLIMMDDLQKIKGVKTAVSVTNAYNLVKDNQQRNFGVEPMTLEAPVTQEKADSLGKVISTLPFYKGLLYDDKSGTYLILVTLEREILVSRARNKLVDKIEDVTSEYSAGHDLDIHYSGMPYIRIKTAEKIEGELYMFILLALVITGLILYLFFRSARVVVFSLLVVTTGVIWSLGSIALLGYEITLLTAMIPPLLIVIGIPNSVFLLNKYHNEFRNHGNKIKALQRVIQKIGAATFLTNLTTAAGFATFILTSTRILQEFGVVASINIMGIFILSILLIPIIFSFLPDPRERHVKHLETNAITNIVSFFEYLAANHRMKTYPVAIILVVLAIVGITKIKSTGYVVDDLPKNDPVYTDLLYFEEHFRGLIPLEIIIDTKRPRAAYTQSTLQKIDELQTKLEKYPELSKPLSIAEAFKFARQSFFNGAPHHYRLPGNTERSFIMAYMGDLAGDNDISSSFVDSENQITRISYKMSDIGTEKTGVLANQIRQDIDSIFPADRYDVTVTGAGILSFQGNKYLVRSLLTSLAIAIFVISGFMAWMFSSARMMIISLIPNLVPLLITASFMGYFGIPVKPSTVLVFSIAFGISVDNTIHFLAKYRQELKVNGLDIRRSVSIAIREAGVSMLYTAIVLFFGFGIFSLSGFGGTVALGILISFTLLIAVTSNLILLPSMLLSLERIIIKKNFEEPLMHIYDENGDSELEGEEEPPVKQKHSYAKDWRTSQDHRPGN
ncbi:MAG: efflux RND transporter permease subunit [Bacteroidales bacterium]